MALQIALVKTPAKVSVSKTSQTFSQQGGTLGRADGNAWVLPDPDKFLSSCHCEILFDANTFYLLDLSTNGTFYNNSLEPLGKGTKAPLNDGDFFEVGEYRFSIKMVADQHFVGNSPFAQQALSNSPSNSPNLDDIFGHRGASVSSSTDPFSGNGFLPADFSLDSDSLSADPLLALDRAQKVPNNEGLFGRVHTAPPKNDIFLGHAQTDHSPSVDQAISWPAASQENLIPEDWGGDFNEPAIKHEPLVRKAQVAVPVQVQIPVQVQTPIPVQVQMPAPKQPSPNLPPVAIIPAVVADTIQASSGVSNVRLITALGLDASKLTAAQSDEISDLVGELMREVVEGMMQVLRSRASIKNEFRMNVTTIQPVENNPLKFSVGVDEALETMFIKKTNAYKKPIDAFREGFQEIGEHQVAMIAGIRFGFERMVERFNPENLEKNFNKQGKGGVIPGMQKAKYWNSYRDYYSSFLDNMESSFQYLFGSDFVNAYEDQLRKLAAARKKNK
jgi:type VI secretion system protein